MKNCKMMHNMKHQQIDDESKRMVQLVLNEDCNKNAMKGTNESEE